MKKKLRTKFQVTTFLRNQPVSSAAKHIPIGAGGLEFDSKADQTRHSFANGSPQLWSCAAHALSH